MPTITTIATSDDNFSILVSALQYLDSTLGTTLVATLDSDSADLTVFAPTNGAFGALAADLGFVGDVTDTAAVTGFLVGAVPAETLLAVIQYHVSAGTQTSTDIATNGVVTTLQGGTITGDLPTLVDAEPDLIDPSLVAVDIAASNGIVHVIDRVLLPIDLPGNDAPTITDIVASSGTMFDDNPADFDILLKAVTTAGLEGVLADETLDLTAFAPTDAAFVGLAQALGYADADEGGAWGYLVEALTLLGGGDPIPLLTQVLTYHVAGESLQASQVLAAGEVATLQGGTLTLDGLSLVDADPDVGNPSLIATDIQAANGVVHVIDGVLLPADLLASDGSNDVDFIIAGDDRDVIRTGRDNDYVDANGGNDFVRLGKGEDVALGGTGHDFILGNKGADIISGDEGRDALHGGRGNDTLKGGADNDILKGGSGHDIIDGGTGNDIMLGGRGGDTFVFAENSGHDAIYGFGGHDQIDLSALGFDSLHDVSAHRGWFGTSIDLGDGNGVFLAGFYGHLGADDFIL